MDITKVSRVLILAPHTDDGELGAGGTIAKLIDAEVKVFYAAFSTAAQSVPVGFPKDILKTEVRNATYKLGIESQNLLIYNYEVRKLNYARQEILEELTRLKNDIAPDLILLPSMNDIHQDHSTVSIEGLRAFKHRTVLGYELIWNNLTFSTSCFIKLDRNHIQRKADAVKEYTSQSHRDYVSEEFIFSLAKVRGVQIGCEFAEAFEVMRLIF